MFNEGTCVDGTCLCPDGFTDSDCGTTCLESLQGTWVVKDNNNSNCDFASYEFSEGDSDTSIRVRINSTYLSAFVEGDGEISDGCLTITYEIDSGNFDGEITFDGNILTDKVTNFCTITAERE